jgi:hypothetical protein
MHKETPALSLIIILAFGLSIFAQQRSQAAQVAEPKSVVLLFREDFKTGLPNQLPLLPEHVTNSNLELKLYGPGAKAGKDGQSGLWLDDEEDPANPGQKVSYIWTGVAPGSWAVMLKEKNNYLDLRGPARLRWRTRPRGLHMLHPLIKLADGTMLVADYGEPGSTYWRESEIYFVDIPRWRTLDPTTVAEAPRKAGEPVWMDKVDLSQVDEIGFTDLMGGAGKGAQGNSGIDWIEVYGNPVKRSNARSYLINTFRVLSG